MKEESMSVHAEAVKSADAALYDAGFADGVASVPVSPDVQAQIAQAVADAMAGMQPQIDALKKLVDDEAVELSDVKAHEAVVQKAMDDLKAKIKALLE